MLFEREFLTLSLFVFAAGPLFIWPSRWNIPAFFSVAFWIVSGVIPVYVLGVHERFPEELRRTFLGIMILGSLAYLAGLLLGKTISAPRMELAGGRVRESWATICSSSEFRLLVKVALAGGLLLVLGSLSYIGMVPMFEPNPFEAKFFRGSYAEPYGDVAILLRLGFSVLTFLIPVGAALILDDAPWAGRVLVIAALATMLVTMQRGPAMSGMLVFIGVLLARKGLPILYAVISIAALMAGALFYTILGIAGIGDFAGVSLGRQGDLLSRIAETAPDVADQLFFLARWQSEGSPFTQGATLLGGLVPGQYRWNPGVWTLNLGDPSVDLNSIVSGGIRLSAPMAGAVSAGTTGVVLVCLCVGVLHVFTINFFRMRLPTASLPANTLLSIIFFLTMNLPFWAVSYGNVVTIGIGLGIWVMARRRVIKKQGQTFRNAQPAIR